MIECKKCLETKPVDAYYKHPLTSSGLDSTCKDCRKAMVAENRAKKIDYYREFDRKRANDPNRVLARKEYRKTEAGKAAVRRATLAYHKRYPAKRFAHNVVNAAIRDGKLIKPEACESCGSNKKIEAHHCDYTKPYDVNWLCESCHKEWHKNNSPIYE